MIEFCLIFGRFRDLKSKKIDQKSIKKAIKNKMRFWIDFGWLLDRFWSDFGPKLGGKMGPSWHQNLKNGGPKTMSKKELKKMSAEAPRTRR